MKVALFVLSGVLVERNSQPRLVEICELTVGHTRDF